MALIKCPECNRKISSAAFFCPGCGYPINPQQNTPKKRRSNRKTRRANGAGSVYRLSGNRRNPWVAIITVGWEINESTGRAKQIQRPIGYFPTESKANLALDRYNENPYDLDKETTTIEQLYERWSKEYFEELTDESSVRTIRAAWQYVPPVFRMQNAVKMTPQGIKDMINNDAQRTDDKGKIIKASDGTKSRMKSMFNLMYDYAVLATLVQYNPARQFVLKGIQNKIERKRKDKVPFTHAHEAELWDDIEFGYTRMVLINIYSGWRPEELLELSKDDINLEQMTMTGGMKTDAGFNRTIPIHPKIADLVIYYYNKSSGSLLFYDYDGSKPSTMTYDKYRGRFKKILARHGWQDVYSPSCPRHTFSTRAKEARMDDLARKKIMGHEISDVTDKHYTHLNMQEFLMTEITKIK
ncbi:tyrosine-type recombinase/integrase [Blautia sp.]|uniref:tyrosine-type recombinase/integrase n=1 Tax=Blautia sp. TaxID=1955243 RepID=UPI002E79A7FA|nr:tyrosine-type recombinase/integrase [Blautia sp.]MEE0811033.1 tyrosine-type recombinase/integrase [Blautia sp.]